MISSFPSESVAFLLNPSYFDLFLRFAPSAVYPTSHSHSSSSSSLSITLPPLLPFPYFRLLSSYSLSSFHLLPLFSLSYGVDKRIRLLDCIVRSIVGQKIRGRGLASLTSPSRFPPSFFSYVHPPPPLPPPLDHSSAFVSPSIQH